MGVDIINNKNLNISGILDHIALEITDVKTLNVNSGQKTVFFITIKNVEYVLKVIDITPYELYSSYDVYSDSDIPKLPSDINTILSKEREKRSKRIQTEIKMTKKCPNLPQLCFFEDFRIFFDGYHHYMYYIEEKVSGNPLSYKANYTISEIIDFILQLITHVEIMYKSGYVHRDIKPNNIMNYNGIYNIIDGGLAKNIYEDEQNTIGGMAFLGTPGYSAPEQENFSPNMNWDFRTDLYPIGIIAIEMSLPGLRKQFKDLRDLDFVYKQWKKVYSDDPLALNLFRKVISKLCARERFKRFSDIDLCKKAVAEIRKECNL